MYLASRWLSTSAILLQEHKQFSFRIKLQCVCITELTLLCIWKLQTLTGGPTKLLVTEFVETNTNMINQNVYYNNTQVNAHIKTPSHLTNPSNVKIK